MDPEATLKHAYDCYKAGDLDGARECLQYFMKWKQNNGECRWEADAIVWLLQQLTKSE